MPLRRTILRITSALAASLMLAGALARPALAQAKSDSSLSGLAGAVVDSLHGGVLKGAIVQVVGTGREGTTDSTGRYHIDSIPPGSHRVALFHPLLDTLGLSVVTNALNFDAGKAQVLVLGTPSPATAWKLFCGKDTGLIAGVPTEKDAKIIPVKGTKPAAVLGRVVNADTDEPVAGADVTVTWAETGLGAKGIQKVPVTRTVKTDAGGAFHVCGVPGPLQGTLKAAQGKLATGEVPVAAAAGGLVLAQLNLGADSTTDSTKKAAPPPIAKKDSSGAPQPIVNTQPATVVVPTTPSGTPATPAPRADATPSAPSNADANTVATAANSPPMPIVALRTGHATLTGRIVNASGVAIPGAFVMVQGAAPHIMTGDSGTFTLKGLPSGTQTVMVKAVGYSPISIPINLSSNDPAHVYDTLMVAPAQLDTVHTVSRSAAALHRVGFTDRQKMGMGKFLNDSAIGQRYQSATSVTQLLWGVPGLRTSYDKNGNEVLQGSRGGGCVAYVVDGQFVTPPPAMPSMSSMSGAGSSMGGGTGRSSRGGGFSSGSMGSSSSTASTSTSSSSSSSVDIEQYVQAYNVGAVEVYQASETPAQFQAPGKTSCVTVVIWTKGYLGVS